MIHTARPAASRHEHTKFCLPPRLIFLLYLSPFGQGPKSILGREDDETMIGMI